MVTLAGSGSARRPSNARRRASARSAPTASCRSFGGGVQGDERGGGRAVGGHDLLQPAAVAGVGEGVDQLGQPGQADVLGGSGGVPFPDLNAQLGET